MNTQEFRQLVLDLSGRGDLVGIDENGQYNTSVTPAPMDVYIQAGLKTLDQMLAKDLPQSVMTQVNLKEGYNSVTLPPGFRAVERVWRISSLVGERREITRVATQHDTGSRGVPETYALSTLRSHPHLSEMPDMVATKYSNVAIPTPGSFSLLFNCLANAPYIIQITGRAYNFVPAHAEDSCWWFVEHALLAAKATAYHIEVAYRNTEGANDWLRAIQEDMLGVNADLIRQIEGDINDWM